MQSSEIWWKTLINETCVKKEWTKNGQWMKNEMNESVWKMHEHLERQFLDMINILSRDCRSRFWTFLTIIQYNVSDIEIEIGIDNEIENESNTCIIYILYIFKRTNTRTTQQTNAETTYRQTDKRNRIWNRYDQNWNQSREVGYRTGPRHHVRPVGGNREA